MPVDMTCRLQQRQGHGHLRCVYVDTYQYIYFNLMQDVGNVFFGKQMK